MGLAQRAEQLLELPGGSLSGEARIEIDGKRQLTVTGSCEIREYEESLVRLLTRVGELRVNGDALVLDHLHCGGVSISGRLLSIEFL